MGFDGGGEVAAGRKAVLAQKIRNAHCGNYMFTVEPVGEAATADEFAKLFAAHFECRLTLIRYRDTNKDRRDAVELGTIVFIRSSARRGPSPLIGSWDRGAAAPTSPSATAWASCSRSSNIPQAR